MRIAIVVSRFNDFVTERLLAGARDALRASGLTDAEVEVLRVPGAFEIPMAARQVARTGRVAAEYDRLVVSDASPGGVVIKYHWMTSLQVRPISLSVLPVFVTVMQRVMLSPGSRFVTSNIA